LLSAVTTAFIVQVIPQFQPDPVDLTNALLLRILEQNTTFSGTDPLAPILDTPTTAARAHFLLFASLAVTLFVAFIAVLGKQWILYYTRITTSGNIVDRGKERQAKLVGLQKWGLHLIMQLLPVMLQFALLLFGVALTVYLWDLDIASAEVVLLTISVGLTFYTCTAVVAMTRGHFPFQTFFSVLIPMILRWAKATIVLAHVRFRHWSRRRATSLLLWIERATEHSPLASSLGRPFRTFAGRATVPNHPGGDALGGHYSMTLSNPAFWRKDPLFNSSIPKDISASAGFWLLENSANPSTASAVAAIFSEIQWPSHYHSTTALNRLHDAYAESLRAHEFNNPTRLRALQSAAAYYILYHTQLIWSTSNSHALEIGVGRLPPHLPPDLFVHLPSEEWGGDDVFEYLLHTKDRSEPVTSARFLSYIAPYWFCGDSDSAIMFRQTRLETLYELIQVLEESRALNPATVTDCVLCVGAAMDFPLHPEDLIRVDKRYDLPLRKLKAILTLIGGSDYFASTFKMVVEHIHAIILAQGRLHLDQQTEIALEILFTLVMKTTLSLVNGTWINELLRSGAQRNMDDDTYTLFLKLSARRKEEGTAGDVATVQGGGTYPQLHGRIVSLENSVPEYTLFSKILKNVKTCIEKEGGWQNEAVYGGLIAIMDIPRLESCLPEVEFIQTLSKAMETEEDKPFRIRKAAFDVVLAVRDGWLRSADLRQAFRDSDVHRQLYDVVIETARLDYQVSLLKMTEILSEDAYWHSHLREAMDIWLPFRHGGPDYVLRILSNVGELPLPEYDGLNPPLDEFLVKLVKDEWTGVPGRPVQDLTAGRLKPLVEVTELLNRRLFTETDRGAVLAVVEHVIPSLERQDGGPREDVRRIIDDLLEKLRSQSTGHRSSTYWL